MVAQAAAARSDLQHTAALLMQPHATGRRVDLQHATGQLRRVLGAEGWAA
jgi:hypothetical protein